MKAAIQTFLLFIFIGVSVAEDQTIFLIQVTQHGKDVPKVPDGWDNTVTGVDYDSFDQGTITEQGVDDMILLGQSMRNRYMMSERFLPEEYSPKTFLLKVGEDQRTTASAFAFMNGVYTKTFNDIEYIPHSEHEPLTTAQCQAVL